MNPTAARAITLGVRPDARIVDVLPTGLPALDALIQGFPRGAISEIAGPDCSGPVSAAASGVALSQLVWVRCHRNPEHALKAADYLLHAGGFGTIVLDLCQVAPRLLNRIPISYWYRFRRALENPPTILALVEK